MQVSAQEFTLLPNVAENLVTLEKFAEIAQLVEHNLAKVGVASSSLVFRSKIKQRVNRSVY